MMSHIRMTSICSALIIYSAVCLGFEDGISSPKITTNPNPVQSPFRVRQTVEFTCEVDPIPSQVLTYQWRVVENSYGTTTYSGRSFNKTFSSDLTLRFCWYFCSVMYNQTLLGTANKLVEVHGLLYTEDAVTRTFLPDGNITLSINHLSTGYFSYLAQHVSSLIWYHNGTKLFASNRVNITNNGTTLVISDMMETDAGKYEVKIGSIEYSGIISTPECDRNILPMLETTALHAPVTFYVQQFKTGQYNPEDVVQTYYVPTHSNGSHYINYSIDINTTIALREFGLPLPSSLYKDGVSQSLSNRIHYITRSYGNKIMLAYKITYNDTKDVVGYYVYTEYIYWFIINHHYCQTYLNYHRDIFHYQYSSVFILYWRIQEYDIERTDHGCPSSEAVSAVEASALRFLSSKFGVSPLGLNKQYPGESCDDIIRANPYSRSGMYWIRDSTNIVQKNCIFY